MVMRDGHRTMRIQRLTAVGGAATLLAAALAGCSSGSTASSIASSVKSAAAGAASQGAAALQSGAAAALASASAAAASAVAGVKDGVDAKNQVKLGGVTTDADGKSSVEVTVTNSDTRAHDYTVNVNFLDSKGSLADTTVLTIKNVGAGASGKGTAHSNRKLSGTVTAEVGVALRH
jgi:hypothetical protein